jgi:hypothetical protein
MATIKTTGSGSALRIITKTVSGVARVSCLCCGCDSVPDEITVVFSGITLCPNEPAFPTTIATAILTKTPDGSFFTYNDGNNEIDATCFLPSDIVNNLPELIPDIPAGIDLNGSTPLFIITYRAPEGGGGGGPDQDGTAFIGGFVTNGGSVTNKLAADDCFSEEWAYGGTATLSWE